MDTDKLGHPYMIDKGNRESPLAVDTFAEKISGKMYPWARKRKAWIQNDQEDT